MALARLTLENLPRFEARIVKLTADTKPAWGALSPAELMVHFRSVIEMSLEEKQFEDRSTWFSRNIMRVVAFHIMPSWPKGKIKAPAEFTPEARASFEDERNAFLAAMRRFVEAAAANPNRTTRHSLFGPLTLDYWTFMHARHFEHHFDQFGV